MIKKIEKKLKKHTKEPIDNNEQTSILLMYKILDLESRRILLDYLVLTSLPEEICFMHEHFNQIIQDN